MDQKYINAIIRRRGATPAAGMIAVGKVAAALGATTKKNNEVQMPTRCSQQQQRSDAEPTSNPNPAPDDTFQPSINTETVSAKATLDAVAPNADTQTFIPNDGRPNTSFDCCDSTPSSNFSQMSSLRSDLLDPLISVDPTDHTVNTTGTSGTRARRGQISKENMLYMIKALNSNMVISVTRCLDVFITNHEKAKSMRFSREYFGICQVVLTAKALHRKIIKSRITYHQLREYLENLGFLFETQGNSMVIGAEIRALIFIVENLTSNLERCCGKTPTDWITVAKLFSSRVVSNPPPIEDLSNILDHIRPIKKLSENQFGNFYQARLANSVLCILRLKPIGANESSRNSLDCVAGCVLSSPFITRYYASFSTANAYAIVIEHLDGIELQNVLSVQARIPEEDLKCYLGQLVLALEHLHRRGFICRSLQPSNMMLLGCGRVKIVKLDNCKICIGRFTPYPLKTFARSTPFEFDDGEIVGSYPFIAPEVLRSSPYGRSIDWWALGVTAFHLFFGHLPFTGPSTCEQAIEEAKKTNVFKLKWLEAPRNLRSLLRGLMAPKPSRRLCSVSYGEIKKHSFFLDFDWLALVSGEILKDSTSLIEQTRTFVESEQRKELKLVKFEKKTGETLPYFTFVSPGFARVVHKISTNQTVLATDIVDPPDSVVKDEKYSFKFKEFRKTEMTVRPGVSIDFRPSNELTETLDEDFPHQSSA